MPAAKKAVAKKSAAKRPAAKKAAPRVAGDEARALMRGTRQSPYKMRLVIDEIRGKDVNEALALPDVLEEARGEADREDAAVGGGERGAGGARRRTRRSTSTRCTSSTPIVNEGPKLKRFMPAAMGRATPIQKRTSHVEIVVAEREGR